MDSILVVEDTDSLREVLCTVLRCEGYQVTPACTAEEGLNILQSQQFSLVLSDLKLPGKSGLDFLREAKTLTSCAPILVMTAFGTIDIAVEAMKYGAVDFITKPFDPERLCSLISQVIEHKRIIDRSSSSPANRERMLITQNQQMEKLLLQAAKVASLNSSVLILGESGSGKELIARYIHEHSLRKEERFLAVNCGSMPGELLESEFFGHEAGAFTGATESRIGLFELASDGTLFLDEIANMPPALQMKLLRTLQEGEVRRLGSTDLQKVNTRVISATNCDLSKAIRQGNFREDLYFRLGVITLEVPPLRERKDDISLLTTYFLKSFAQEFEKNVPRLSAEARQLLENYAWPGNVRELENAIERAMIFSNGPMLEASDFDLQTNSSASFNAAEALSLSALSDAAAKSAEIEAICKVLGQTNWNKSRAAKVLGVSYKTLLNKVKEYGLES